MDLFIWAPEGGYLILGIWNHPAVQWFHTKMAGVQNDVHPQEWFHTFILSSHQHSHKNRRIA